MDGPSNESDSLIFREEKKTRGRGKEPIETVQGLRIVERGKELFARLSDAGTERDTAGNRRFLYSHYASLLLLSMFNPAMQSLRGIQEASQLKQVQMRLGTGRVSLGSLSESSSVFDPELLVPLIEEARRDVPTQQPGPGPHRNVSGAIPQDLAQRLVAVDGSALKALPQIVRAASEKGAWKLHLQFRPLRGHPGTATLAREHAADERDILELHLEPDCIYLADRGYERYALYNRIVAAKSDYVIRGQERPVEIVQERPLTAAAQAARVISDTIVKLSPNQPRSKAAAIQHGIRRIVIAKRDQGRRRADRRPSDQVILYTNLLDVPAEVVAAIYELRWSIELFFRFLKQMLGLRRLFSDKPDAVAIQVYCALLACLLLAETAGCTITMKIYRLVCFYLQGLADAEELECGLRDAREKAAKKIAEKEP